MEVITHGEGAASLYDAVLAGESHQVEVLLAAGADPHFLNEDGYAPLHCACFCEYPEVLEAFRQHRGNLNLPDRYGRIPICLTLAFGRLRSFGWFREILTREALKEAGPALNRTACSLGYKKNLLNFLQEGASQTPSPDKVKLPMPVLAAQAVFEGSDKKVRELLSRNCDPNAEVHAVYATGSTLLHMAVSMGNETIVASLLEFGADPDVKNSEGESPKDVALRKNYTLIGTTLNRPPTDGVAYKNNSYPRGLVVILNNNFGGSSEERQGAHQDVENITTLFETLDYTVELLEDLDCSRTMEKLKAISRREDLLRMDSAVFFLLSHGGRGGTFRCSSDSSCSSVFPSSNSSSEISPNTFMGLFNCESCPGLAGKPKIWFFGFCRGGKQEKQLEHSVSPCGGVPRPEDNTPRDPLRPWICLAAGRAGVVPGKNASVVKQDTPLKDTLAVFPVQRGFKNMRDLNSGSLGVYYFCEAIKNHRLKAMEVVQRHFKRSLRSYTTPQVKAYGWDKAFYFSRPRF